MRPICFLLQDTGAIYGAERATLDLMAGLGAAGLEVRGLLIEELRLGLSTSPIRDVLTANGIPYELLPVSGAFSHRLAAQVRRQVVGSGILHAVGYKANVHGVIAAGMARRFPTVATVHGWLFRPDLKERFYKWIDLRALRRMDRVVALSCFYENLLARSGVPRKHLSRIPSGLPLAFRPSGEAVSASARSLLTFGMLGRLSWEKNHMLCLEAARQLLVRQNGKARFLLAGEGPEQNQIVRAMAEMGLSAHIELRGFMDRRDFFSAIDALVICSRIENLPYSALEAMAWGKPVIATRVGGLPDLVADGENGLLVPANDAGALAQAMERFVRNPELVAQQGRVGRARLEAEFTLERCVQDHVRLYDTLSRAGRGP
jgi:glycosyltransferase involved in cell wall biosynthesis